jgi:hypothetical protein
MESTENNSILTFGMRDCNHYSGSVPLSGKSPVKLFPIHAIRVGRAIFSDRQRRGRCPAGKRRCVSQCLEWIGRQSWGCMRTGQGVSTARMHSRWDLISVLWRRRGGRSSSATWVSRISRFPLSLLRSPGDPFPPGGHCETDRGNTRGPGGGGACRRLSGGQAPHRPVPANLLRSG